MKKNYTELIMKLDYAKVEDVEKLISLMSRNDIKVNKIGIEEYSIVIEN